VQFIRVKCFFILTSQWPVWRVDLIDLPAVDADNGTDCTDRRGDGATSERQEI